MNRDVCPCGSDLNTLCNHLWGMRRCWEWTEVHVGDCRYHLGLNVHVRFGVKYRTNGTARQMTDHSVCDANHGRRRTERSTLGSIEKAR